MVRQDRFGKLSAIQADMSKIFQASKRAEGEIAALIGESLPAASSTAPPEAPLAEIKSPSPAPTVDQTPVTTLTATRRLPIEVSDLAPLLPFDGEHWQASEQYRMIRTKLLQHPASPRMILISSAGPGDGKSVTAINLAGVLSLKTGAKVLLMDSDFRRPAIHTRLGFPQTPGLAGVLTGTCTLEEALIQTEQFPNLTVIPAGESRSNPAELLDSKAWHATCRTVRNAFDYIILDSPPIAAVADSELILAACDGVVIVVRPDHTSRDLCRKAINTIPRNKCIGILLNCVQPWFLSGKSYYSGSHYYYQGNKG
jgi:protein-tyrosine kinase